MRHASVRLFADFSAGAFEMGAPVGGIAVLIGVEVLFGAFGEDFLAQADGAVGAFAGVGKNHFGTVAL